VCRDSRKWFDKASPKALKAPAIAYTKIRGPFVFADPSIHDGLIIGSSSPNREAKSARIEAVPSRWIKWRKMLSEFSGLQKPSGEVCARRAFLFPGGNCPPGQKGGDAYDALSGWAFRLVGGRLKRGVLPR